VAGFLIRKFSMDTARPAVQREPRYSSKSVRPPCRSVLTEG
jgi:hypothetical protein